MIVATIDLKDADPTVLDKFLFSLKYIADVPIVTPEAIKGLRIYHRAISAYELLYHVRKLCYIEYIDDKKNLIYHFLQLDRLWIRHCILNLGFTRITIYSDGGVSCEP